MTPRAPSSIDRASLAIFTTLFVAYGYFHQGGGWNQNSRFDQVRSLVEEGSWSIDRFSVYELRREAGRDGQPDTERLVRRPFSRAVGEPPTAPNTLDLSFFQGHLYPNKPPGTTLLALPAYAATLGLERSLGIDPDDWAPLTLNLYLTTVFSVGLIGALGGVLLYHLSRRLHPEIDERWHAAAALALGLATFYFPLATLLFDQVPAAVATLAGWSLLVGVCDGDRQGRSPVWSLAAAGAVLGLGVLINYSVVLAIGILTLYLLLRFRSPSGWIAFGLGGAVPAAALALYHRNVFGSVWATSYRYQSSTFVAADSRLLGVLAAPDWTVATKLLFGEERGLLWASPVLLVAFAGLGLAIRRGRRRLEAGVSLAVFAAFLLFNASFNGWHGGNCFGPRYLLPALPFLGLFIAPALARWPRLGLSLAGISLGIVFLATAVDPQIPPGIERPFRGYVVPALWTTAGEHGDPVSRNETGVYEMMPHRVFGPGSLEARWNAFNLGELVAPARKASLLPLVAALGLGVLWVGAATRPWDRRRGGSQ